MNCACGAPIGRQNKSGRCRPCNLVFMNTDPDVRARRSQGGFRRWASPESRERQSVAVRKVLAMMSDDERERRRMAGRAQIHVLFRPDVRAKAMSPEGRAKAAQSHTNTRLHDIPEALRDLYRHIAFTKRFGPDGARSALADMIPGTPEHAKRTVKNSQDVMQIKHERDLAQQY